MSRNLTGMAAIFVSIKLPHRLSSPRPLRSARISRKKVP